MIKIKSVKFGQKFDIWINKDESKHWINKTFNVSGNIPYGGSLINGNINLNSFNFNRLFNKFNSSLDT